MRKRILSVTGKLLPVCKGFFSHKDTKKLLSFFVQTAGFIQSLFHYREKGTKGNPQDFGKAGITVLSRGLRKLSADCHSFCLHTRLLKSFAITVAMILLMGNVTAQQIKPLSVGDTLPDMVLSNISNYPVSQISTAAFKNKNLIIDFWATYCTSCIKHFGEMDSLQQQYSNQLQVLLVNSPNSVDTEEKKESFIHNYLTGNPRFPVPFVNNGNLLLQYFPHHVLPHYVWINAAGIITAITNARAFTQQNITAFLQQKVLQLPVKNDNIDTLPAQLSFKGKVLDIISNKPVAGVWIRVSNTKKLITADAQGNFSINNAGKNDTLQAGGVGYITQKILLRITLNENNFCTLLLTPQTAVLNDVIVYSGYQNIPKERAAGSFEKIDNRLLNNRISTDVLSKLENISSVYIDRRNNNQAISIHGASTIYANTAPLVVIDNFPYDGDLNNINPNIVESITILKDAAAASIWGVRAGNGVIVITTKKGYYRKESLLECTANITVGNKPDLYYTPAIGSTDFIGLEKTLFDKGFYNSYINNTTTRPVLTPVVELLAAKRAGTIAAADADAQVNVLMNNDVRKDLEKYWTRQSVNQQYALNYSGGGEKFRWLLSGGYDQNAEYLMRNGYNRISLNMQNAFIPVKGLEITAAITYTQTNKITDNAGISMANPTGKTIYPYAKLADDTGNALATPKDYRQAYLDTAGNGKLLDWKYRPLDELNMADNRLKQTDLLLNISAVYNCNKNLSAEIRYQFEKQNGAATNLYGTGTYLARNLINLFTQINGTQIKYGVPNGAVTDLSFAELLSNSARAQINYHINRRGKQDISFIGGGEIKQIHNASDNYRTYGFNPDILTYGNVNFSDLMPVYGSLSAAQQIPNPASFAEGLLRYLSAYSNASYSYDRRYTFSLSARKDASNLFGVSSNLKAVPLWSAGFAWQLNNERFYRLKKLPLLKLRLTYGYNGNIDNTMSAFTTMRYFTGATYTGQPYTILMNPPNPELRWEKSAVLNTGIDFATRNNRITGTIDYYIKKGTDLIGQSPTDPTTGVLNNAQTAFGFKGNVADMEGRGIDMSITANNLTGRLKWSTTLLFNYNTTKVTRYGAASTTASAYLGGGRLVNPVLGKPLYAIYSYQWAGLDSLTGDPRGYLNGQISKDYTALVNIPAAQLQYNGSAIPVYYGSLRNTFGWKQLSLTVNIAYKLGYYFARSSVNYASLLVQWSGHSDYAKRWQNPGDEKITNVPSFIYPISNSNREAFYNSAAVLVERGDHIRLQDINLSYVFAQHQLQGHLPFKSLQVYGYLNNIGILWKANKTGLDPDYFSGGFPLPLSISFGLKATL